MALTNEQNLERKKKFHELQGRGLNGVEIAKELGICESTLRRWRSKHLNATEQALKDHNMPTSYDRVWMRIKDADGNLMTVACKGGEKEQVEGIMDFIQSLDLTPPKFKKIKRPKKKRKTFAVLDPADVHLQKVSSHDMNHTMNNYIETLDGTCDELLSEIADNDPEKIVLVIGNDVLHVDSGLNQTTAGTRQDCSDLWFRAYNVAFDWYYRLILRALEVADVKVVFNKSNHDRHLGFTLAKCLEQAFAHHPNVDFEVSFKDKVSCFIGGAGLMFSHGENGKPKDYAQRMPFVLKGSFDSCQSFHVYLHHVHHADVFQVEDFGQVTVESVRSPSVPDMWHEDKGYTSIRCISAFIHDYETGFQTKRLNCLIK